MKRKRLAFEGISIIGFCLFISWILLVLAWAKRYNAGHLLWFCDIALVMTAIGLFLRSRILLTAQLSAILIFHLGWNIEFWFYLFFGYLPIGSTAYMFYHDISLFEKSLSFFSHVFIVPFALYGARFIGASKRGWLLQWSQTFLIFLLTYIFTQPEENINWMFGNELLNVSPAMIQPVLYYALMIVVPPLVIYWPTNKLIVFFVKRWKPTPKENHHITGPGLKDRIPLTTAAAAIFFAAIISVGVSHLADLKCTLDSSIFQVKSMGISTFESLPTSVVQTKVEHILFGNKDVIREAPLVVWPHRELPKQLSGSDHKFHVHSKTLLRDMEAEVIPSVPQEILIRGKRRVTGSVVWAFVASDDFYIQKEIDLHVRKEKYEVRCAIGGRGLSEYVNPLNGEVYPCTAYNEILGNGTGAIYIIGVIEVIGGKVSSISPYYVVKRKGIHFPEDMWFIFKNGKISPLFSNPTNPMLSRVAFQSSPNPSADAPDVYTCNFWGYEIRNLTNDDKKFDGFVRANGKPFKGIGWVGPHTLRYCTKRRGKLLHMILTDR